MANCDELFRTFNTDLQITDTKNDSLKTSRRKLRKRIRAYFEEHHPDYKPKFFTQGSYPAGTTIRTKDDTCDLDDGVYFESNPDGVSGTTLQKWVKEAVDGTTDASPKHRIKCITVDYKAGYNIDLPVLLFNSKTDAHPCLAINDNDWQEDDPKEFIYEFTKHIDKEKQLVRIVKYLKAWCDFKREKMPSGLSMTVLAMNHVQRNSRDDVALKFTLIEIERELKLAFKCTMPTTPKDNLFDGYNQDRQENFMNNLAEFIKDAKKAVDEEKNQFQASKLWQGHLGDRFSDGEDIDERSLDASSLSSVIGTAKPYFGY